MTRTRREWRVVANGHQEDDDQEPPTGGRRVAFYAAAARAETAAAAIERAGAYAGAAPGALGRLGMAGATAYVDVGACTLDEIGRRPAGARLLADAAAGRLAVVVVAAAEHLGVDFGGRMAVRDLLAGEGVEVLAVPEGADGEPPDVSLVFGIDGGEAGKVSAAAAAMLRAGGADRVPSGR